MVNVGLQGLSLWSAVMALLLQAVDTMLVTLLWLPYCLCVTSPEYTYDVALPGHETLWEAIPKVAWDELIIHRVASKFSLPSLPVVEW